MTSAISKAGGPGMPFGQKREEGSRLKSGDRVVVVGAGPAGCFFAVNLLRQARLMGRDLDLVMIEKKRPLTLGDVPHLATLCTGCNHGAGGLSPRICDILDDLGMTVPEGLIQSRVESVTIQGHWKNVELAVPPERDMLSVFRGSLPATRSDRAASFDAFLLDQALSAGARLIGGEVREVSYSDSSRPLVHYDDGTGSVTLEADFLTIATGVNYLSGPPLEERDLFRSLRSMMPGFTPPRLRKTLVGEIRVPEGVLAQRRGEVYFIEYGSADLRLEMGSIIPKAELVTVVLIGPTIDAISTHSEQLEVLNRFLALPHVQKLLPGPHSLACTCGPSMVTGISKGAVGDRVAVIGDLATSRLYKDGIYSGYETSRALARTVLTQGTDKAALRKSYWPAVTAISRDNLLGHIVFLLHRITFSNPLLSRVFYQALFTERKAKIRPDRRLERTLWSIASGDASYKDILRSMMHPRTAWSIATGGLLVTMRNYVAELFFGLKWRGFGRHTTGVYKELFENKRRQFMNLMASTGTDFPRKQDFERMYTIKVRAPADRIFTELGRFGDEDRAYFRPRFVEVRRVRGEPNRKGSLIRYKMKPRFMTFNLMLERCEPGRHLVYRVLDGFARGGVMVFEIEDLRRGQCGLSIYVTFDFPTGSGPLSRPFFGAFKLLFPAFVHDVIWNHSLCELKDCVESQVAALVHGS
jgi:flavin-dependent dehydrogenase